MIDGHLAAVVAPHGGFHCTGRHGRGTRKKTAACCKKSIQRMGDAGERFIPDIEVPRFLPLIENSIGAARCKEQCPQQCPSDGRT